MKSRALILKIPEKFVFVGVVAFPKMFCSNVQVARRQDTAENLAISRIGVGMGNGARKSKRKEG